MWGGAPGEGAVRGGVPRGEGAVEAGEVLEVGEGSGGGGGGSGGGGGGGRGGGGKGGFRRDRVSHLARRVGGKEKIECD